MNNLDRLREARAQALEFANACDEAIAAAQDRQDRAKKFEEKMKLHGYDGYKVYSLDSYVSPSREMATAKRRSMDLSNALTKLRRPRY